MPHLRFLPVSWRLRLVVLLWGHLGDGGLVEHTQFCTVSSQDALTNFQYLLNLGVKRPDRLSRSMKPISIHYSAYANQGDLELEFRVR